VRVAILASALVSLLLSASCARSLKDDSSEPVLISDDAGLLPIPLCVDKVCPAPFATCANSKGPCTTNLKTDVTNCGACGAACPKEDDPASKNGSYVCSDGVCQLACALLSADCNNNKADGCETSTVSDPQNCGFCGNTCKDGEICWLGACGCPKGFTQCGNTCKKLDADDDNCSSCGKLCRAPEDPSDPRWICGPSVTPANTKWTCAASACNLSCKSGFGDCNKQFCADGCETDLLSDRDNCGACGKKCESWQTCVQGACLCPQGTILCDDECVDVNKDPNNCGKCGKKCPGPAPKGPGKLSTGSPSCENGVCSYTCFPGFADCDFNIANGCEVNLNTNQWHCGSCETWCDTRAGQPCVEGKCLTKPCPAGSGPR
jgi:hypothetical protein